MLIHIEPPTAALVPALHAAKAHVRKNRIVQTPLVVGIDVHVGVPIVGTRCGRIVTVRTCRMSAHSETGIFTLHAPPLCLDSAEQARHIVHVWNHPGQHFRRHVGRCDQRP
jgi:hypothetical protein